ncbi:hypothetical protein FA13DRAFT_1798523 [Coprinellus micaceus]|uniref:Uncharacterized protein n=1 Tax=Coprinellus micaceus TaxID=71717 RepID=A0A4Y7SMD7_COPMI|nr:hypothetical protein FA13DRAFT_1798523 [Coprinellus micaceus]
MAEEFSSNRYFIAAFVSPTTQLVSLLDAIFSGRPELGRPCDPDRYGYFVVEALASVKGPTKGTFGDAIATRLAHERAIKHTIRSIEASAMRCKTPGKSVNSYVCCAIFHVKRLPASRAYPPNGKFVPLSKEMSAEWKAPFKKASEADKSRPSTIHTCGTLVSSSQAQEAAEKEAENRGEVEGALTYFWLRTLGVLPAEVTEDVGDHYGPGGPPPPPPRRFRVARTD